MMPKPPRSCSVQCWFQCSGPPKDACNIECLQGCPVGGPIAQPNRPRPPRDSSSLRQPLQKSTWNLVGYPDLSRFSFLLSFAKRPTIFVPIVAPHSGSTSAALYLSVICAPGIPPRHQWHLRRPHAPRRSAVADRGEAGFSKQTGSECAWNSSGMRGKQM